MNLTNMNRSLFCIPDRPRADFPHLKGRGAEVKDLVAPLLECWEYFQEEITYEYSLVHKLLSTQLQIQDILSDHAQEIFLPALAASNLITWVDNFLHDYTLLANKADGDGELLWNITPKFHWLWHWAQKSIYLNPRRTNCMIDEDFVRHMKKCVASCTPGTAMEEVPGKVMEKYQWVKHFDIHLAD